jgi:hypothetical protein
VEKEYMDDRHQDARIKIYNALAAYHTSESSPHPHP